jgi:phosphopantetheinyl transferase (holo-ACP synthase)
MAAVADEGEPLERLSTGLGSAEWSLALSLRPERRRRDFVLGRRAAREAIRLVLGEPSLPRHLEIMTGTRGEPTVDGHHRVRVSVSHSKGLAAACAWTDTEWSAGIDIERIRPTEILDGAHAFSRRERELLGRIGDRSLAALAGWVVKEASWKALALDRGGPEALEIEKLDAGTGRAVVRATGGGRPSVPARVGRFNATGAEYLLAVVWAPRRVTPILPRKAVDIVERAGVSCRYPRRFGVAQGRSNYEAH